MSLNLIEELYSLLREYRGSADKFFLQSNDFLSLSKPTKENLNNYTKNTITNKMPTFFLYPVVLFKFIKLVSRIILQFDSFPAMRDSSEVSSLYVSHYFGENKIKDKDNFFGNLPIAKNENSFEINYIDQNKTRFFSQRIKIKRTQLNLYLLGFTRLEFVMFQLIFKNLTTSFGLLKSRRSENRNLGRLILLKAAFSQVGDLTLRNQILAIEITQTIQIRKVRNLWLTLEGHGFERSIIAYLRITLDSVSINLYQHAPIVKSQIGLFQLIEDFKECIFIHTSGEITYDYITSKFPNYELQISILGSSKNEISNLLPNHAASKKESLLFLPEGTLSSFNELANIATELRKKYDGKIIFRPHPNLSSEVWKDLRLRLEGMDIELSYSKIEYDFQRSLFCVYRSSAAAIESLRFGVLPINYQESSEINLDCLALGKIRYPIFSSVDELIEILNLLNSNRFNLHFSNQFEFDDFAKKYFVKMKSLF